MKNSERIQKAFDILHHPLAAYVCTGIRHAYGPSIWWDKVLSALPNQRKDLPEANEGDDASKMSSLDISACLRLLDYFWNDTFRDYLPKKARSWAKETLDNRNELAHKGLVDFTHDEASSALDSMWRLCDLCERKKTTGGETLPSTVIQGMMYDVQRIIIYGTEGGSAAAASPAPAPEPAQVTDAPKTSVSASSLPSWRLVAEPHPDVWKGRYLNAEFAADLSQVARGEGTLEYSDPVEFFSRTYMTDGINDLLAEAMKRVDGHGGDPVIQLQTAFGGGKTHSMLVLYHALGGRAQLEQIPNLKPAIDRAGVDYLPKANVAVVVGTAMNPAAVREPDDMPGVKIHTLWGEIAYQLARGARDMKLFDMVRDADAAGTSPGSETLKELFDAAGPCMILMDELVAYGRNIYDKKGLPAGTFDSFIVFMQHVTEAARASRDSLVVASIPESDTEIGGAAGQITLRQIQQMFARVERVWKPVSAEESFEVVRRRLFLDRVDAAARDKICAEYASMYRAHKGDFPAETKERAYEERMRACYPIHPEIFDRLYEDWSTTPSFQRTRGVLRLMATLIHELWSQNDGGAMIMPGSFALNVPNVRNELTRHLPDNWNAIIDREIDGDGSVPVRRDSEDARFGKQQACRRVARAIMFGSAPSIRAQNVRGIETSRIALGIARPEDNLAVYADAREYLRGNLSYMFSDSADNRYWYDTRPNLRRTAEERASQVSIAQADEAIRAEIKRKERGGIFSAVQVWPADTGEVPDEQELRLVVISLDAPHSSRADNSPAQSAAEDMIQHRGSSPRSFRNMLIFAAADEDAVSTLREAAAKEIAWKSIHDDKSLNLDKNQVKETEDELKKAESDLRSRIIEAYRWTLVPYIDRNGELNKIMWNIYKLASSDGGIVERAAKKLKNEDEVAEVLAPKRLKDELGKGLWGDGDSVEVKVVWDNLCRRCYLPRLANYNVLESSIRAGVEERDYFALAAGIEDGRYIGLKWNESKLFAIDRSSLIVKNEAATKQIASEGTDKPTVPVQPKPPTRPENTDVPKRSKHFGMTAKIEATDRGVGQILSLWDDVIKHLINTDGAVVEISIDVSADVEAGLPPETERAVSENCKALKVDTYTVD